jgi:4-hydroxybenzoate polyprenyltransferase
MLALQVSIGALNDLVDAPADAGRKPGKPIPRGAARPIEARLVWLGGFVLGLALSAPSGMATVVAAALGAGCGYAYDLRLSRTAWSWLPLAVGLPILPVHAWLGATGSIPQALLPLLPLAVLAGAGLALANGLADEERDRAAGIDTAVVRLGGERAWLAHAALNVAVLGLVVVFLPRTSDGLMVAAAVGGGLVAAGTALARSGSAAWRERAWELEAVGIAVVGAAWIGALGRSLA